jgi:hypothetical protein
VPKRQAGDESAGITRGDYDRVRRMRLIETHGVPLKDSRNGEPLDGERITGDKALGILA